MPKTVIPKELVDVQTIADKLANLPKEALIYIAGYAEGRRDRPEGTDDDTGQPSA